MISFHGRKIVHPSNFQKLGASSQRLWRGMSVGWAQQKLAPLEEEGAVTACGIFVLFFSLNINKSRTGVPGPSAVSHRSLQSLEEGRPSLRLRRS